MLQKLGWSLLCVCVVGGIIETQAIAQISPDNTLGREGSLITPNGINKLLIEGGATRGRNLFHSFSEFNVGNGQQVYFSNPVSIENIISRVTGSQLSNIDGTLGVLGNANLFLINPNGIVFGPNARLDIRGSFFASTSDRIDFQDGSVFSATNPEASPLLTMSMPLGLDHWLPTSGTISNAGILSTGKDLTLTGQNLNLQGQLIAGENISLVASESLTASSLQILAGGSVTIPGSIIMTTTGESFEDHTVTLSDGTLLEIRGTTQPTLEIRAGTTQTEGNITIGNIINPAGLVFLTNQLQQNANLTGDISVGSIDTASESGGGTVVIDSRGGITVGLINTSGGNIFTESPNLAVNGGNVTLLAQNNLFLPFPSAILSYGVIGGTINLQSETAIIQEDAPLGTNPNDLSTIDSVTLFGIGGDINLKAPVISIGGNVQTILLGAGQGGNIQIIADTLTANQATIAPQTFGEGNSGKVSVNAGTINLDFSLLATVTASPLGGNAGDVDIRTNVLTLTSGAQLGSLIALGETIGNAGNITIIAQDSITLSGFAPKDLPSVVQFTPSSIFSSSFLGTQGNSGQIVIETGTLTLTEGALIGSSIFGVGDAGQIEIKASESVVVDGAVFVDIDGIPTADDVFSSSITSEVFTGAIGQGGSIIITTPILQVTKGGTITASTNGQGDAGNININASQSAIFDGFTAFETVGVERRQSAGVLAGEQATGQAGTLTITTPSLSITNGSQITAQNRGTGTAGNIVIQANSVLLNNQGLITAETFSNTGGNITLQANDVVVLRRNSRISTTAGTAQAGGDGGNIVINTPFLVAQPRENSDITANAFTGQGGRVDITAEGIFGLQVLSRDELAAKLGTSDPTLLDPALLPTSDITAISQVNPNLNGEVIIRSPDTDSDLTTVILPADVIEASRLIARDCAARGAIAQQRGSLVVTGRGGLPAEPTGQLRGETLIIGWDNPDRSSSKVPPVSREVLTQLVEVQKLVKRPDGKVILVAQTSDNVSWNPSATCQTENGQ